MWGKIHSLKLVEWSNKTLEKVNSVDIMFLTVISLQGKKVNSLLSLTKTQFSSPYYRYYYYYFHESRPILPDVRGVLNFEALLNLREAF